MYFVVKGLNGILRGLCEQQYGRGTVDGSVTLSLRCPFRGP